MPAISFGVWREEVLTRFDINRNLISIQWDNMVIKIRFRPKTCVSNKTSHDLLGFAYSTEHWNIVDHYHATRPLFTVIFHKSKISINPLLRVNSLFVNYKMNKSFSFRNIWFLSIQIDDTKHFLSSIILNVP